MQKDKTYYEGIYGNKTINLVRNIIHIDPIEEKGIIHNWHIKPHIHPDLFQIFVLEKGYVELLFNDEAIRIDSPAFCTIPKNVLHGFNLEPNMSGWVISLSDRALENMLKQDAHLMFAIDEVQIVNMNSETLNPLVSDAYTTIYKCVDEFYGNLSGKELALQYLVGMLLLRLNRIPETAKNSYRFTENAEKIYFRRFEQLIKKGNAPHKTIEEYCSELAISPKNLTRICRNVTGKSPKDTMIDYFIGQAKTALYNFEKSIAEIAYDLNFEDPHYFSRLFKKKTGLTPKEYRNQSGLK